MTDNYGKRIILVDKSPFKQINRELYEDGKEPLVTREELEVAGRRGGKTTLVMEMAHEGHPVPVKAMRTFVGGATRDVARDKNDYEGFFSPLVLELYGDYMREHQIQPDGQLRDSDNWQKGMPRNQFMKSLWRHLLTAWKLHRGWDVKEELIGGVMRKPTLKEALCGILFNTMGYLHELLIDRDIEDAA